MFSLIRLILIDSYKPGTLQEVRLDGPTNLNGINGAGKTTLLRLIPLFFGESPSRLVPKSRVNESFVQHYLPHDSSYIIFEYQRNRQTCQAVMYASPNEGGLCYRFVDKGFAFEDFLITDAEGMQWPISCRDLARHLGKKGIFCSIQLTARNDYRTVIQNLPNAKGAETRQMIARFSFCESAGGRRLQHIEKIVTGMFMRSTDFRDLREMLVSCIEEERDAITLELKTDTLEEWCKEYQAFLHAESRRDGMAELEQIDEAARDVQQALAELAARVRRLAGRMELEHGETESRRRDREHRLSALKLEWDNRERELKRERAETEAHLNAQRQQSQTLEFEKAEWERQNIGEMLQLYENREAVRADLDRSRETQRRLLEKVNDIDAEFGRLKAEKTNEFQNRIHERQSRIQALTLEAEQEKNRVREAHAQREGHLHDSAAGREQELQLALQALRESRGQLSSQLEEIQADPTLLQNREAKRTALDEAHAARETAAQALQQQEARIRQHEAELQSLDQVRRQLAERRRQIDQEEAGLQRHLDADAGSLLGFLREHHPGWTEHIAKVINPELLLRDDLSPALIGPAESFFGVGLSLELLSADRSASEASLREALTACRSASEQLSSDERKFEEELAAHQKTRQNLDKARRELDLAHAQCRAHIKQIKEESASLEHQIETSRRERRQSVETRMQLLEAELETHESALAEHRTDFKKTLLKLREDLSGKLAEISRHSEERARQQQAEIESECQRQQTALAALEIQRLASLAQGGVDTQALGALEDEIGRLAERLKRIELAAEAVEKYQRWQKNEWPRHASLQAEIQRLAVQFQQEQQHYDSARAEFERQQTALQAQIAEQDKHLATLASILNTLMSMQQELERYPRLPEGAVVLDASHTLAFLQKQKHELMSRERELHKQLIERVSQLKRALDQFPGTQPASYRESIVKEIGLDASERAWLPYLRDWYATRADELRRVLTMQANTFGSAVRNYHQALARFDRGIDSLSRRLTASIDRNIGFEKIEAIQARLLSNVSELGYWQQIVAFTELYVHWQRSEEALLPTQEFADAVRIIASQLQAQGRVETRLVNLLSLEIAVTENGRVKRATHDEELRQISSHGLSYLILCVFFVALVNMIRKEQPVCVVWPMDELKDLHQINIERLLVILNGNNITLLSAFPDPDPEVLKSFKNRYEIYGYRELIEMVVDEDEISLPESDTTMAAAHV
ncbi:MAG: ATP-binding protein [Methylococcus sp.]|nr:ATP-binding protein [Methylococcus sp.]